MPPKWFRQPARLPARRVDVLDDPLAELDAEEDDEEHENEILAQNREAIINRYRRVAPPRREEQNAAALVPGVRYPVRNDLPRGDIRSGTGHLITAKCWMFTLRLTLDRGYPNTIILNDNNVLLAGSYRPPQVGNVFGLDFIVCQIEVGANGTLVPMIHYQGYFEWNERVNARAIVDRMRWNNWDMNDIWLSPRRSTQEAAIAYCTKEASRMVIKCHGAPFVNVDGEEYGDLEPTSLIREGNQHAPDAAVTINGQMMAMICKDASYHEIAVKFPEHIFRLSGGIVRGIAEFRKAQPAPVRDVIEVRTLWGDTGLGKTTACYLQHPRDIVYKKNFNEIYFEGMDHRKHRVLLLDEFGGATDKVKIEDFLLWLDLHPQWLPQKYGGCYASWTMVYITSNKPPREWFPRAPAAQIEALYRRLLTGGIAKLVDARKPNAHAEHQAAIDDPQADQRDHKHVYFLNGYTYDPNQRRVAQEE